jgi:hypothetical protein
MPAHANACAGVYYSGRIPGVLNLAGTKNVLEIKGMMTVVMASFPCIISLSVLLGNRPIPMPSSRP